MEMSFSGFSRLCTQIGKIPNPDPVYIPSPEETDLLVRLSQSRRPAYTT